MASKTFRQLIRFCVDAYGIERLLRLVQAIVQILAALPTLLSIITYLVYSGAESSTEDANHSKSAAILILVALKRELGLIRRFFRAFRFLDAFNSAYALASTQNAGSMSLTMTLDIMTRTFNGMYLLLESTTLVDVMGIEGLTLWSRQTAHYLKVESQWSWFFALVSGGMSCAAVLYQDQTERHILQRSLSDRLQVQPQGEKELSPNLKEPDERVSPDARAKILKRLGDLDRRRFALSRKLMANCLDLALPGSVIGWVPASAGIVGACMLVTSILTGWEVWERCGREVSCIP